MVSIDKHSGFCFGVIHAIRTAEKYLQKNKSLYCLGDIVHNSQEVNRLVSLGLVIITPEQYKNLRDTTVLIRAHGEPPATYKIAKENNITLIDATCQVVAKLQSKIKTDFEKNNDTQILIFGKQGHAEVEGLLGQTHNKGKVISSLDQINEIDTTKPAKLYAQTTQNVSKFEDIISLIRAKYKGNGNAHLFQVHNTVCKRVSNRAREILEFAEQFDGVVFVSDEKSSNGLFLFEICKNGNPNTFFISSVNQLQDIDLIQFATIGICGATSTPIWLMKQVAEKVSEKK